MKLIESYSVNVSEYRVVLFLYCSPPKVMLRLNFDFQQIIDREASLGRSFARFSDLQRQSARIRAQDDLRVGFGDYPNQYQ